MSYAFAKRYTLKLSKTCAVGFLLNWAWELKKYQKKIVGLQSINFRATIDISLAKRMGKIRVVTKGFQIQLDIPRFTLV